MHLPSINWQSRKVRIIGAALLMIIICLIPFLPGLTQKRASVDNPSSVPTLPAGRDSAQVYIKKFSRYNEDVSPRTRVALEKMLYNHSYILNGNDLYTGIIREDSYTIKRPQDGSLDIKMLVDIIPTNITYEVSVTKNKSTHYIESFDILCAPKSEQKDTSLVCKDEQGR